jgi:hypothetical protein
VRERIVSLISEHFIERSNDQVIAVHILDDVMGLVVPEKNG